MKVVRKDTKVEWDIHPSYYEKYKDEFIVVQEEEEAPSLEDFVKLSEEEETTPVKTVKKRNTK